MFLGIWRLFKTLQQFIIATLCLCHRSRILGAINELFRRWHLAFVCPDSSIVRSSSISVGSIQNFRVCCVQTSRLMCGADGWMNESGPFFQDPDLPRLPYKTKRTLHSYMQILQQCVAVKKRETILSNDSDGRNVSVLYIASVCTSFYHLLIACC
jgi:hypothetical protein